VTKYFQKDFGTDELKILRKLGIDLTARPDTPRDETRRTRAPKPYILKTLVHCQLCGKNTVQFFSMELDETDYVPVLRAKPISLLEAEQRNEVIKSQHLHPNSCSVCFEALMKLKKEELVRMVIKSFPLANM